MIQDDTKLSGNALIKSEEITQVNKSLCKSEIANLMNMNINIITDEERVRPDKSEVERLFASNNKAKKLLNWSPTYYGHDGFKRGLQETIKWFTNPSNLANYKSDKYNI